MRLLSFFVVNTLALLTAIWLIDGITLSGGTRNERILELLVVGAIFAVINYLIKPVIKLLSFPFVVLTLGLFLLVVNALMLLLTSAISGALAVNFHVEGFWTAVLGGVVVAIASWLLGMVFGDGEDA